MKFNKIIVALSFLTIGTFIGCDKKFDGMLNNPNAPTPDAANADLYLTQVQLSFASFFDGASDYGMQLSRQIVMYGPTYENAYTPQGYDGLWSTAYTSIFKNANALIPIADAQKKYVNVAMAKILKAYTLMTLVDLFGDVPYTEANLGVENTNPKADKGADVYASAIALLDAAIADLAKTPAAYPGTQDLFYNASSSTGAAKWRKAAKTLKLRAYMTTRLVDASAKTKIEALLTENDLINSSADDFEFKYGTKDANPNSRSPKYVNNYLSGVGGANDYMGTYMMWCLIVEKGGSVITNTNDPRSRYFFYRQRTNYADVTAQSASCSTEPRPAHYPSTMPFCLIGSGYWGRDHGDGSGIPPDRNLRTSVGVYPFGGEFDSNQGKTTNQNLGGKGAGVAPVWLATYTHFIKAEAALMLGVTTGGLTPRAALESGVRESISKVVGFPSTINVTVPTTFVPDATRIDTWVNTKVLPIYDAAATTADKLDAIMKEYYIALWGNGVDAYNMYRRTGKPANIQLAKLASPGNFVRSHLYPSNYVNLNQNAAQKSSIAVQVFWDNNPAGFIK